MSTFLVPTEAVKPTTADAILNTGLALARMLARGGYPGAICPPAVTT